MDGAGFLSVVIASRMRSRKMFVNEMETYEEVLNGLRN